MGFFSELKNDLSQAVNTLMPDDKADETAALDSDKNGEGLARGDKSKGVDIDSMLNKLDDIKLDEIGGDKTEEVTPEVAEKPEEVLQPDNEPEEAPMSALDVMAQLKQSAAAEAEAIVAQEELEQLEERIEEQTEAETEVEQPQSGFEAVSNAQFVAHEPEPVDMYVAEEPATVDNNSNDGGYETMDFEQQTPTDETASITEGMVITGDLQTTGSLDLIGKVTGNLKCLGKLNVTGEIVGDSDAAEIYAESARITGEVRSKGSVKVGQSTVIVGNIFGSSAVIAGAVKGDIDVHGPVVLDTTAIVMGNIKSQSVQINNGAVIEGMCSQAYADVNPSEFFETLKNR